MRFFSPCRFSHFPRETLTVRLVGSAGYFLQFRDFYLPSLIFGLDGVVCCFLLHRSFAVVTSVLEILKIWSPLVRRRDVSFLLTGTCRFFSPSVQADDQSVVPSRGVVSYCPAPFGFPSTGHQAHLSGLLGGRLFLIYPSVLPRGHDYHFVRTLSLWLITSVFCESRFRNWASFLVPKSFPTPQPSNRPVPSVDALLFLTNPPFASVCMTKCPSLNTKGSPF